MNTKSLKKMFSSISKQLLQDGVPLKDTGNASLYKLLAFVLSLVFSFSHQIENEKLRCAEL